MNTKRIKRLVRMAPMWIRGTITFGALVASINLNQKAICLIGGGMVLCDREDERLYFQEDDLKLEEEAFRTSISF